MERIWLSTGVLDLVVNRNWLVDAPYSVDDVMDILEIFGIIIVLLLVAVVFGGIWTIFVL